MRLTQALIDRPGFDLDEVSTAKRHHQGIARRAVLGIGIMLVPGFVDRGGKGSHRNYIHARVTKPITLSGKPGDDAKRYQERAVKGAIEESKK